jgi:hypothetical protein
MLKSSGLNLDKGRTGNEYHLNAYTIGEEMCRTIPCRAAGKRGNRSDRDIYITILVFHPY